ncbi:MAG: hypothetical protein ACK41E_04430 [Deinococcales bacterium]
MKEWGFILEFKPCGSSAVWVIAVPHQEFLDLCGAHGNQPARYHLCAERLPNLQHTALEVLRCFASVQTSKSTISAGDALFSSFAYFFISARATGEWRWLDWCVLLHTS